jgi:hypothetical protein
MCFLCIFVYKKKSQTSKRKFSFKLMIPNIKKFRDRESLTSLTSLSTLIASPSVSNDSLVEDYNENLNSIVNFQEFDQMITSSLFDSTIDRFSLLNIKSDIKLQESDSNKTLKAFNDEIETLRHIDSDIDIPTNVTPTTVEPNQINLDNDDVYTNLTLIQRDIMPKWSDVNKNEKHAICSILIRWQGIIKSNFDRIKNKKKVMKDLELNEKKYNSKGKFDYDLNRTQMKKLLLNLFKSMGGSEVNKDQSKVKPNTRLILRAFKKFNDTFDCLEVCSKYEENKLRGDLYWVNLRKYLQHTSKALLRCALYVYQNAHLNKCSLGTPPLYVIESDYCDEENVPYVKFETLYEFIYLTLSQLDTCNKEERRKFGHTVNEVESNILCEIKEEKYLNKKKLISKYYILMLNCLIRLIQITTFIRECLTMKQIAYKIDIYSHAIEHECRLFREYLKEILKIED